MGGESRPVTALARSWRVSVSSDLCRSAISVCKALTSPWRSRSRWQTGQMLCSVSVRQRGQSITRGAQASSPASVWQDFNPRLMKSASVKHARLSARLVTANRRCPSRLPVSRKAIRYKLIPDTGCLVSSILSMLFQSRSTHGYPECLSPGGDECALSFQSTCAWTPLLFVGREVE